MISQATVLVSVLDDDVITKDVAAVRLLTLSQPGVPPSTCEHTKTLELAVIFVFAIVTVPATKAAEPIVLLVPSLIERASELSPISPIFIGI